MDPVQPVRIETPEGRTTFGPIRRVGPSGGSAAAAEFRTLWRKSGGSATKIPAFHSILAELDLLMAIDGFPSLADLGAAGAQRI